MFRFPKLIQNMPLLTLIDIFVYACVFTYMIYVMFLTNLVLNNSGLEVGGEMNLAAGIQVAQLALKHRQNKKQQQRIIVFAGR